DLQRAFHEGRVKGRSADDYLLLVEHPPVYTVGRNGDGSSFIAPEMAMARGAEVFHVDRGGDITFHGPGQLVGYPIIELADPKQIVPYVRKLEEVLIRLLADFGVDAWREEGLTGVWTEKGKVAALGVRVSRRVTMHGFAVNLRPELVRVDEPVRDHRPAGDESQRTGGPKGHDPGGGGRDHPALRHGLRIPGNRRPTRRVHEEPGPGGQL